MNDIRKYINIVESTIASQLKNISTQQNVDYDTLVANFSKRANLPPNNLITDQEWEEYYEGMSLVEILNSANITSDKSIYQRYLDKIGADRENRTP